MSKRKDIELHFAVTGQEGIDLAESVIPDLVLLDINLPDMNGLEVFKKIKNTPSTQSIPVVVLSADAMTSDIQKALQLGVQSYITKPINISKFVETIDEYLKSIA